MKNIIFLALLTLVLSCDNQSGKETKPVDSPSTSKQETEAQIWASFWSDFQAAVAADDMGKVGSMCHFTESTIQQEEFEEMFSIFFHDDLKDVIENTPANQVELKDNDMTNAGGKMREISWSEEFTDDDGVEYGTALYLYFAKKDGEYRMIDWMSAG